MEYNSKQEQMMKNFFSTSLFILASVFMLLAGCKEDELPLPGENGTAMNCPSGWPKRIIPQRTRTIC